MTISKVYCQNSDQLSQINFAQLEKGCWDYNYFIDLLLQNEFILEEHNVDPQDKLWVQDVFFPNELTGKNKDLRIMIDYKFGREPGWSWITINICDKYKEPFKIIKSHIERNGKKIETRFIKNQDMSSGGYYVIDYELNNAIYSVGVYLDNQSSCWLIIARGKHE